MYWTPNWKGGRRLRSDGRYEVWLKVGDDFSDMRGSLGYCLEHRLVMAQHLNRSLRSDEHVHHINGDPGDNRIENLQLRAKAHGQGVSYRCMDCGSHRVEPVEL